MEFFYHSFTDVTILHKQTLEDFKQKVTDIAERWQTKMQQMSIVQLHEKDFLERVKRSAEYFEKALDQLLSKPLKLTDSVQSKNKQAMKQLTETLADLNQSWLSRRYLLRNMSEQTFSIATYLHQKQHTLLDALDEQTMRKEHQKRKKKETKKGNIN